MLWTWGELPQAAQVFTHTHTPYKIVVSILSSKPNKCISQNKDEEWKGRNILEHKRNEREV